jgi:hypothetical protein
MNDPFTESTRTDPGLLRHVCDQRNQEGWDKFVAGCSLRRGTSMKPANPRRGATAPRMT